MRVLLLQLDGKLPNLALMRAAAHHRALGDDIELRVAGNNRLRLMRLYRNMEIEDLEEISDLSADKIRELEDRSSQYGYASSDILQYAIYCNCLFDFLSGQLPNQTEVDQCFIDKCKERGFSIT